MSVGKAPGRTADARFLTGKGRCADDIAPERAMVAVFLRAPVANADIPRIDRPAARAVACVRPGLDSKAPKAAGIRRATLRSTVPGADGSKGAGPGRRVPARQRLRLAAGPVATVVAETAAAAQDGAGAIVPHRPERPRFWAMGAGKGAHPGAPGNPSEPARTDPNPDGALSQRLGKQSNGQGHDTVFPRRLPDRTGVPVDRVRLVRCDSALTVSGGGTGGSRSAITRGTATLPARPRTVAAFAGFLAPCPGTGTAFDPAERPRVAGRADSPAHSAIIRIRHSGFPHGAHRAGEDTGPEPGAIRVDRHLVLDDFCNLLSPILEDRQAQGGIAPGRGRVMAEGLAHKARGQVLSGSFMDYAVPRAPNLPRSGRYGETVPTAANPLGMKMCGEAGRAGALPAPSGALADALALRAALCDAVHPRLHLAGAAWC
jgi:CO/xanthine dehydrogenase Mo-binding subunit